MACYTKQDLSGGMALVMVLVFSSALLLLGTTLLSYACSEMLIAGYQEEETRLYYITEAGLEAGLALLQRDFLHREPVSGTLDSGTYTISFAPVSPEIVQLTCTATLGRSRKTATLQVERDLLAGSESLTSTTVSLRDSIVYGGLHAGELLTVAGGPSTIFGNLYYREGSPPVIAEGASLEVTGFCGPAAAVPPVTINFEQLAVLAEEEIPGGLLQHPPAQYPECTAFLVRGDLEIASPPGETFELSGLVYIEGDLTINPAAGSILLLDGLFAVEGSVNILPGAPLNDLDPPRHLVILAAGEIYLGAEGEDIYPPGGRQIFYSRSAIRVQGQAEKPLQLKGTLMAPLLQLEYCTLHYEPELLQNYAALLPGLGKIRAEWVKEQ